MDWPGMCVTVAALVPLSASFVLDLFAPKLLKKGIEKDGGAQKV